MPHTHVVSVHNIPNSRMETLGDVAATDILRLIIIDTMWLKNVRLYGKPVFHVAAIMKVFSTTTNMVIKAAVNMARPAAYLCAMEMSSEPQACLCIRWLC